MFCHNCGEKSEDGVRFCSECGTELVAAAETFGPAPQVQPMAPEAAPVPASPPPTGAGKIAGDIALTPISICAALLIFSFFMPWITIEGLSVSGYKITELARLFNAEEIQIVWAVPLLGAAALVAGLYRKHRWLALPAGAASISTFIYLYSEAADGRSSPFSMMGFGAWLMLVMGVALVVLGIRELGMSSDRAQKVLWITTGCLALVAISDFIMVLIKGAEIEIDKPGFYMHSFLALFAILTGVFSLMGPRKRADGLLLIVAGVFMTPGIVYSLALNGCIPPLISPDSLCGSTLFQNWVTLLRGLLICGPLFFLSITCVLVFLRQRRQAAGPS